MSQPSTVSTRAIRRAAKSVQKQAKPKKTPRIPRRIRRSKNSSLEFVEQATDLPRNEQLVLRNIIDRDHQRAAVDFVKALILPQYAMARVPDSFLGSTAIVRSFAVIDVPAFNASDANDTGRFAAVIQPHFGSLDDPTKYKIAMVDASSGWPTDLTSPSSFVSVNNSKEVRVDTYFQILTQPQLSCTWLQNPSSSSGNQPFGVVPLTELGGYGLSVLYNTTTGDFTFPPGMYKIDIVTTNEASLTNPGPILVTVNGTSTGTSNVIALNSLVAISDVLITAYWSGMINVGRGDTISIKMTNGGAFIDAAYLSASPVFNDTTGDISHISANNGLVQKMRPVATSALLTYTGPPLTGGGEVAIAYLPGSTTTTQFFNNGSTQAMGNLSAWQNVAAVKGNYNGPLTTGAYAWYSPEGMNDLLLRTPDEAASFEYPNLLVAGQYSPGSSFTDGQVIARLLVVSDYEFVTDSTLFESKHQPGSQAIMDKCLNSLAGQTHCMPNKTHVDFANKALATAKKAMGFLEKNPDLMQAGTDLLSSFF